MQHQLVCNLLCSKSERGELISSKSACFGKLYESLDAENLPHRIIIALFLLRYLT